MAQDRVVHLVQVEGVLGRSVGAEIVATSRKQEGTIELVPIGMDHGGLSFAISVYNGAKRPKQIEVADISVTVDGVQVAIYGREELMAKERSRAERREMVSNAIGSLSAAALSAQRDTYTATVRTPSGTYRSVLTAPSISGQLAAQDVLAESEARRAQIDAQLDETLRHLAADLFKRTELDPGESYAGRLVTHKVPANGKAPVAVEVRVNWNGEQHVFGLQIARAGTLAPRIEMAPAPPIIARKAKWAQ